MIITVIAWMLLILILGAGTTFAVIAFFRPDRLMTWLAAGSLLISVLLAWLAHGSVPGLIIALIAIASATMAVFGGGPAATLALQMATRGSVREGVNGGILVGETAGADHEVLRGGATIGVLERFATVASIIAGFPEGLAVIVAIKSVGRFGELAESESRERFIIGTLASLVWACLCAAITRLAMG